MHHLIYNFGGQQTEGNAASGMYAAPAKVKVFDSAGEVGVAQESSHFVVGAGAIKGAKMGSGFALDSEWLKRFFAGDERFDGPTQDATDFLKGLLSGLFDNFIPVLSSIIRCVDHDEPVFTTWGGIIGTMFLGDIDINGRVFINFSLG